MLIRYLLSHNSHEISLEHNAKANGSIKGNIKLVRYQQNPEPNWGPAKAATKGTKSRPKSKAEAAITASTSTYVAVEDDETTGNF